MVFYFLSLPLWLMKQKQIIIRFFFVIALLGSLVAQSFHGFEHLRRQFSEEKCLHKHLNSAELTHQHKGFEQCLVCSVVFQNGLAVENFDYDVAPVISIYSDYFFSLPTTIPFTGSLYSLRGPPSSII